MMFIKNLNVIQWKLFLLTTLLSATFACTSSAQDAINFVDKYSDVLRAEGKVNSHSLILQRSKRGNGKFFMATSSYLGANNQMFKATNDPQYLKLNEQIIDALKNINKKKNNENGWIVEYSKGDANYEKYKGKKPSTMLFEGYLLRYIAEYYYLLSKESSDFLRSNDLTIDLKFLEANFMKWINRSVSTYNDDSYMYGHRTHIGAQWATTALFLRFLTSEEKSKRIYDDIASKYTTEIKANLTKNSLSLFSSAYKWNSTWNTKFTERLKSLDEDLEIQDVSHGNHVIQFILDSYEAGYGNWKASDISRLSRTLKKVIWKPEKKQFADMVDGTFSENSEYKDTGWKQSDGWMKLMFYDKDLFPIYQSFYEANKKRIDGSILNLQFYANFEYYNRKMRNSR